MCFGVGEALARRFGRDEMRVLPAPSAFSLACARLGWPLAEVECLSLHGRATRPAARHIAPGRAADRAQPRRRHARTLIAALLRERGFGRAGSRCSSTWAAAPSGASTAPPTAGARRDFADAQHRRGRLRRRSPAPRLWSCVPGLPDDAFENDGMLTKREVRAATLARLGADARPAPVGCRRRQRLGGDRVAAGAAARARHRDRARSRALRPDRGERRSASARPSSW